MKKQTKTVYMPTKKELLRILSKYRGYRNPGLTVRLATLQEARNNALAAKNDFLEKNKEFKALLQDAYWKEEQRVRDMCRKTAEKLRDDIILNGPTPKNVAAVRKLVVSLETAE